MVWCSVCHINGQFRPINYIDCNFNDFLVNNLGGFCSEFQVPCSELKKLTPRTKNAKLGTSQSTAEASRSCELTAEITFQQKDSKATKGGL